LIAGVNEMIVEKQEKLIKLIKVFWRFGWIWTIGGFVMLALNIILIPSYNQSIPMNLGLSMIIIGIGVIILSLSIHVWELPQKKVN
jgi:hypothetical protein